MLAGPLVFVDVDTQRDFLEPGGSLFIPGSGTILRQLARLTIFARSRAIPVLATACAHAEDDPEFDTFPPHCLIGTSGQQRIVETAWPGSRVLTISDRLLAPPPAHLTVEKVSYDLFSRVDASEIVASYAQNDPTFVVYGVATDYCVGCAVRGFLERGLRVALVVDAIWAIDREAEPKVLTSFAQAGAVLTMTDVVCDDR